LSFYEILYRKQAVGYGRRTTPPHYEVRIVKISFLGATQTVTGSRFLIEHDGQRVMIDCGLFQGPREWKNRNWEDFPVDPSSINCIVLTHAHIDHSGFLPRLIGLGFRGPVYCTPATAELLALMLPDSGHLQEEDATYANKVKYSRHEPALPLYTEEEARAALDYLRPVDFYRKMELAGDLIFNYVRAGHILGSAMVEIHADGRKVLFSGDVGRPAQFITKKPDDCKPAEYIVLESTYGNRLHKKIDVKKRLAEIITRTAAQGGTLVVPSFAIGRTQELLFILRLLEEEHSVPKLPVYIDSPMAIHALPIYDRHHIDFSRQLEEVSRRDPTPFICHHIQALNTVQESKKLNEISYPAVIVSSSGMATGGRILHHLKHKIGDHRNTILFIGYQAEGTKGRFLVEGAEEIKIHGQQYRVKAAVESIDALSCHADYEEMLAWLEHLKTPPQQVFLVHGEEQSSAAMATRIREKFGWTVNIPQYRETVEI
jgi:metallo-beta-lactamase family protein